jgi:4-nitrophenyl phosphatase
VPNGIQEEICGSAYASAVYMSKILQFPKDKRVYVIGQKGIEEELDAVGIAHTGGTVSPLTRRSGCIY